MIECKLLEIRDCATMVPIFAMKPGTALSIEDNYLAGRAGFPQGCPTIIIGRLECETPSYSHCTHDIFGHGAHDRTFSVAHNWLVGHWDDVKSGDVIDVEFILNETPTKKISERLE